MKLSQILTTLPQYDQLITAIPNKDRQLVTGMNDSSMVLLIDTLFENLTKPMLIVCDTLYHAEQMMDDLSNLVNNNQLYEFPVEETVAAEIATSSPDYRAQRVTALHALITKKPAVVVTSVSGINRLLPTVQQFENMQLQLKLGSDYEIDQLQLLLNQMGYTKQNLVAAPGEFSIRGSIMDIYPLNNEYPVRVDFFDTEVDSMRVFDAATQRSIENIEEITVLPANDLLVTDEQRLQAVDKLQKDMKKYADSLSQSDQEQFMSNLEMRLSDLKKGLYDPRWLLFTEYFYDKKTSILDYLGSDGIVVLNDYSRILDTEKQLATDEANWLTSKIENLEVLPKLSYTNTFSKIISHDQHAQLLFSLFKKGLGRLKLAQIIEITTRPMQQFYSQMPMLKSEIDRFQQEKQTVVIMVENENRLDKVKSTLSDFKIQVKSTDLEHLDLHEVQLVTGNLSAGFEIPIGAIAFITEKEMFGQVAKKTRRVQTFNNAQRIKNYTDLKPGDYVVHVNHGIGKFEGMQTLEVDGLHQDYLTIAYQKNDKLFIPVTQLNLIQKYVSSEDKTPKVSKLGGSEWAKTKRKVAAKIEDIADDLIELYAQRNKEVGFAFPKDDAMQHDFENDFPYNETPDQIRSTQEIKDDMEKRHPMDRLLVGDVGFGKTEVALRAAFKAIDGGKQVAMLVPTTILAQQHYETMLNRFKNYAIEVRVLSRFQTKAQVKETLAGLKDGSVDMVVGTHRLLSKDVEFKDLGLLIIDEEQRFGVKHKEKIKQLSTNIDVLTLTATPIPRTLNMSMMGVRDLSVIETPPSNRYPIQTYVMEQNAGAIRDGIERELARNGQVFYLHNRVEDIEKVVANLQELVPDARITYIHGQMTEKQLEDVLVEFIGGKYDVLVTTTIIETGVDISNVNTLFVENADHMGLSQLYQLRGRIGRSSRIAYAYFMYQPNKVLTEIGEKRLEAIRDFTELGSGFKIAMRDLSIRGAGNILGQQQHGFIDSVGYDLYTQMLEDAVSQKQGKTKTYQTDATIEIDVEAYLPSEYIEDGRQKIELYKRIRQISNIDQLNEVTDDLMDRFGDYPQPVANLLKVSEIKANADYAMIEKIQQDSPKLNLTFAKLASDEYSSKDLLEAIATTDFRATINTLDDKYQIKLVIQPNLTDWLEQLATLVNKLAEIRHRHVEEAANA